MLVKFILGYKEVVALSLMTGSGAESIRTVILEPPVCECVHSPCRALNYI